MFRFISALLIPIIISSSVFALNIKNPFKKKPVTIQKMVETKQDWETESLNIPLRNRTLKDFEPPQSDKKHYYPEIKYSFERYNYPAGSREVNIEDVKKNLVSLPFIVSDINIKYGAYPRYYFYPEKNQISSEIYVEKLDTSKTKTDRIVNFHHEQKTRSPILKSHLEDSYPNLFSGLSIVDWDKDSKKLLIKEKIGSINGGIYKTNLYLYFLESNKLLKLNEIHDAIKDYLLYYQDLQIVKYRYDIKPLGFSAEDSSKIITLAYVYDTKGKRIFLGAWEYDCASNSIKLLSDLKSQYNISSSGIILKRVLE